MLAIVLTVRNPECAAIDRIARKTPPTSALLMATVPIGGAQAKELRQRLFAKALTGLRQCTLCNLGVDLIWQCKIEIGHHLFNGLMPVHGHCDDQPDDLFSRELALAYARFACDCQRMRDPLGIDLS